MSQQNLGFLYVIGAYVAWGVSPLIWHLMQQLTPLEIIIHRVLWSMPILLPALIISNQLAKLKQLNFKNLSLLAITAILASGNWLVFVWAIGNGRLVEASLGYFILPLLNVFLGVVFFKEKLTLIQYMALAIAGIGAGLLMIANANFPWVALSLSVSFALYSMLRKHMEVGSLLGLSVETIILLPFAIMGLWWLELTNINHFYFFTSKADLIVPIAGVFTAIPLLWVVAGMKKIPLATTGFLFYINPTLQFLIAVWYFNEPINLTMLISFGFIWLATIIYFKFSPKPST